MYTVKITSSKFPELTEIHHVDVSNPYKAIDYCYSKGLDELLKQKIPHPGKVDNYAFDWDQYYYVELEII